MANQAATLADEVDRTLKVCDLLEQQRDALLSRDLTQIERLTGMLESEFEALASLVGSRDLACDSTGRGPDARELAREVRAAQARLAVLVALNQAIIGDRLACIAAALGQIDPALLGAGYRPGGPASVRARGALTRSA